MNKYLFNKIEQAHSAYFENLIFIANEVCRERWSEAFEEFTELEPAEIAKVLGWNDKESTFKMIEESIKEKEFATTLLQYDLTGFIAECHLPHHL
jgi:inorganic pyrophosphatase